MTFTIMTSLFMAMGILAIAGIGIWMFKDEIDWNDEEEA